ncbi:phosphotransferase [Nonomuraea rhizosphaerae]|uniref:phosphotransferase n=1 Tax=Nonomuraea rhizosphaerae TaxID=2665663 RepID=UPI001C5E10C5|nr:phosphotransferase [Nonomuraea rhizosphaerae]
MPFDDLPGWLPAWCLEQLGSRPVDVLFRHQSMSAVFGLRLAGGTDVVVKVRDDNDGGRVGSCVSAQARLAESGFPCARPLTPVVGVGSLAVHAEEFRPGGEVLRGDAPGVAVRYAEVFARLMIALAELTVLAESTVLTEPTAQSRSTVPTQPTAPTALIVTPPLPNPRWVRWDHTDPGLWPSIESLDNKDQSLVPAYVSDTADRARRRILAADLPSVLGHADFEAHNLRWHDHQVQTVHDWDSLAWQPEAALVGAASAVFPKLGPATLPPVESTEAFLAAYQDARGRPFTAEEQQVAWAAGLWSAAHDVRWEALHGYIAVSGKALWTQAAERLRRANA